MDLKSLQDWVIEKTFESVPDVVDVLVLAASRANTRSASIPDKLISYGLSIGQVEQQLANNNVNAGGSFIEQGSQQINVREVGLVDNVQDIEETVIKTRTERRCASGYRRCDAGAQNPPGPDRQSTIAPMAR